MKITITFSVDEINHILAALGSRPFVEVANLIEKIKKDAEHQILDQQNMVEESE
jgi:hypothetical protein